MEKFHMQCFYQLGLNPYTQIVIPASLSPAMCGRQCGSWVGQWRDGLSFTSANELRPRGLSRRNLLEGTAVVGGSYWLFLSPAAPPQLDFPSPWPELNTSSRLTGKSTSLMLRSYPVLRPPRLLVTNKFCAPQPSLPNPGHPAGVAVPQPQPSLAAQLLPPFLFVLTFAATSQP